MSVLSVEGLSVSFRTRGGTVQALEGVGFEVARGETLALVGESGSGKSVTAYALLGLLGSAGRITSGRAVLEGVDLVQAGPRALSRIRGRVASMIFQNPRAALNPIRAVGRQIADVLRRHEGLGRRAAWDGAVEMLRGVGIPDPARRARAYPFQLSGGMCQRVMIAVAVAAKPALLIADEPTTGLDVTTQALVMDLVAKQASENGMGTILITHDLALAAERAQRIAVMHAGHIVETAETRALIEGPRHPYTARLLAATPRDEGDLDGLEAIPGGLPDLRAAEIPPCRYVARCTRVLPVCTGRVPWVGEGHGVLCWNPL